MTTLLLWSSTCTLAWLMPSHLSVVVLASTSSLRRPRLRTRRLPRSVRHALRWRMLACSNAVLRCAFQAWGARVPVVAVFQGSWLHNLRLSIAPSSFMLAGVCGASAVAIVPSLTDEAERASPGQLHVSIKKVLAKEVSKRRTSAASSPCDSGGGAVRYS